MTLAALYGTERLLTLREGGEGGEGLLGAPFVTVGRHFHGRAPRDLVRF